METRIPPIDKPKGLIQKIAFYLLNREYGKVIMPARVIYTRYPNIMFMVKKLVDTEASFKLLTSEHKFLIQNFVSTLNGCSFCMDISKKKAISQKMRLEKFMDLLQYQHSSLFSDKEKTMLAYVEESTKNVVVADETYEALRQHWSDNEIIEITYVAAAENFLNRLVKPIGIGSDELCEIKST